MAIQCNCFFVFFLNNADISVIFTYGILSVVFFKRERKCRSRGTGKKNFYISDDFISLLKLINLSIN